MRRVAIVGAGQSGLQLAFGLLAQHYSVTLVTNRDATAIRQGRIMSSQCMFNDALQAERDLQLNHWADNAPEIGEIRFTMSNPDNASERFSWQAGLDNPAQSVDQRLKMSEWIEEFERQGGTLEIADVGIEELEVLSEAYDLVILAAGKGEVVKQFSIDAEKTVFDKPQRVLALTYVHNMKRSGGGIGFNVIPGVGEYFSFPALTLSGPCDIMVFEGIPGGEMDCWQNAKTPEQHLATSLAILERYLPWEAERCRDVVLTDDQGYLSGSFTPCVREPILTLPSGHKVLGMADALVVNDPITGQGANSAAKCARLYLEHIVQHGERPFDKTWMNQTFEAYWQYAQHVVRWTNSLLTPPTETVQQLLAGAAENPMLAKMIVNSFDDPRQFSPWWYVPCAKSDMAYLGGKVA